MSFTFKPAVREQTSVLMALAGASGSGKTMSALRLASGLAGPNGKVAFIDTEAGRALHYADMFAFDHGDLMPPFRPQSFLEAIEAAQNAEYDVIIIDSFSHEYDGEGGIIDMADEKLRQNPNMKTPQNWAEPKQAHKRMVSKLLQTRAHLIFCLRAEEKINLEKDPNNPKKTVVVPAGFQPICEKRFMYEMTASLLFKPDSPGMPEPIKVQDQHKPMLLPDGAVTEECGKALREWAHGGASAKARYHDLYDQALTEARKGRESFRQWWQTLNKAQRDHLRPHITDLQQAADTADQGGQPGAEAEQPAPALSLIAPGGREVAQHAEVDGFLADLRDRMQADPTAAPTWVDLNSNTIATHQPDALADLQAQADRLANGDGDGEEQAAGGQGELVQ